MKDLCTPVRLDRLFVHAADGRLYPLFEVTLPKPAPTVLGPPDQNDNSKDPLVRVDTATLDVLIKSSRPQVWVSPEDAPADARPRFKPRDLKIEFSYPVEEAQARAKEKKDTPSWQQDPDEKTPIILPQTQQHGSNISVPLSEIGTLGIVHTNIKWLQIVALSEVWDYRIQRFLLSRMEEIEMISMVEMATPHAVRFLIPRMFVDKKADVEKEIRVALLAAAQFRLDFQHGTPHR